MKKLILFSLFICFALSISAEEYKFKANNFSYKVKNGSSWTDWTKWEDVDNVSIVINDKTKRITIFTPETHELIIQQSSAPKSGTSDGNLHVFNCVNKDQIPCQIRVQLNPDGSTPLYMDFDNVMCIYNVAIE